MLRARTTVRHLGCAAKLSSSISKRRASSIPIYQIDAFTSVPFRGNPAAICPLDKWLPDATLQAIAMENNLSETAFIIPSDLGAETTNECVYNLRWFTPTVEVDLCGHATLATGSLILEHLEPHREEVMFDTRSGRLMVKKGVDGQLCMDFPLWPVAEEVPIPGALLHAMGTQPQRTYKIPPQHGAPYFLLEYGSVDEVMALAPSFDAMPANVLATALVHQHPALPEDLKSADFVCRFFGPKSGIPEDPVTGSAHCTLAPFWSERLSGKKVLRSVQVSKRRGELLLELETKGRVSISGRCALFLEGKLRLPD
mmetsp:Transcript_52686/g.125879  ORF Transcript_52686/g.125879 Transcript_52686/m.125879 type:complete len:312 (+) Transcript_52686:86-1021(+)